MLLRLILLFTVVPAVELFLLLQLGAWLGPTTTFLLILLTGLLGAFLAKREGLGVLRDLQGELNSGLPPGDRLMEGVLVVVGGLLLITPGVFTDLTGFLLIAPPTRRYIAPRALKAITSRLDIQAISPGPQPSAGRPDRRATPRGSPPPGAGDLPRHLRPGPVARWCGRGDASAPRRSSVPPRDRPR